MTWDFAFNVGLSFSIPCFIAKFIEIISFVKKRSYCTNCPAGVVISTSSERKITLILTFKCYLKEILSSYFNDIIEMAL